MVQCFVFASLLFVAPLCASAQSTSLPPNVRIVGYYFAPTVQRGFPVTAIRGDLLTHLNYAFANIRADGRAVVGDPCLDVGDCASQSNPHARPGGNFAELRRLKERYPQLRTLISIGGWSWSGRFSDVAATAESRARFVESVLKTFFVANKGVFDGVDIDWEYPVAGGMAGNRSRPDDRSNYTLLLRELRRALDRLGGVGNKRYLLTIGAAGGLDHIRNLEVSRLAATLDFINVMAYDYHTGGSIAHFNAPLGAAEGDPTPRSNVRATIDAYRAAGAPAHKLVLGVPFYGYGYQNVDSPRAGLFQPGSAIPSAQSKAATAWVGAIPYSQIRKAPRSEFTHHWNAGAAVPWLYSSRTRTWITYDDDQSIGLKVDFVRARNLGGIMIWELSGDDGTLLPAIHKRLKR